MDPPRILVIEDDDSVSYLVRTALELADFEVLSANTGSKGLKLLRADPAPELTVLDIMLPDFDGFDVCRRIRSMGTRTPILYLTARDGVEDRVKGLTLGGDDYMTKPFSVEELVARVSAILRRSGRDVELGLLSCGDLELDEVRHDVRRRGEIISLSPTEFRMLRFMLRNVNRVVTKAQIRDHVWDYDFDGESSVVETYVSLLRKKVDHSPPKLIHTVRTVGYRMSEE